MKPTSIMGSKVIGARGPGFQPGSQWYETADSGVWKILADGRIRSLYSDSTVYLDPSKYQVMYGMDLFS